MADYVSDNVYPDGRRKKSISVHFRRSAGGFGVEENKKSHATLTGRTDPELEQILPQLPRGVFVSFEERTYAARPPLGLTLLVRKKHLIESILA